jgi:ketosteroid isomerase-like protein
LADRDKYNGKIMSNANETLAVLDRHWRALCGGDLQAVIADYAEDAVLIAGVTGVVKGRTAIGEIMKMFMTGIIPAGSTQFTLSQTLAEGSLGYIVWSAESGSHRIPFSSDTFIVEGGRIALQTSAGHVEAK